MAFDVAAARQAGYNDEQIAQYLASKHGFDYAKATSTGYKSGDILNYLLQKEGGAEAQAAPAPQSAAPAQPQIIPGQSAEAAAVAAFAPKAPESTKNILSGRGTAFVEAFKQFGYRYMLEKADEVEKLVRQDDAKARQRIEEIKAEALEDLKKSDERIQEASAQDLNFVEESVRSGIDSFLQQLPGLGVSLVTRRPEVALAGAGAMTRSQTYAEARQIGADAETAARAGDIDAVIEIATEYLPTKFLVDLFGASSAKGLKKSIAEFAAGEIPGEQIATFAQSLNGYINGLDQELANAGSDLEAAKIQAMRQVATAIATIVGGGLQAGTAAALGKVTRGPEMPPEITPRQSVAMLDGQITNYTARIAQIEAQLKIPGVYTQAESRAMLDEAKSLENEIKTLNEIRKETVKTYDLKDLAKKEPAETKAEGETAKAPAAPVQIAPEVMDYARKRVQGEEKPNAWMLYNSIKKNVPNANITKAQADVIFDTLLQEGTLVKDATTGKVTVAPPTTTVTPPPADTTVTPPAAAPAVDTTTAAPTTEKLPEALYKNAVDIVMSGQVSPVENLPDGKTVVQPEVSTSALARALNIKMDYADVVLKQMQADGLVGEMLPSGARPLTEQGVASFKPAVAAPQISDEIPMGDLGKQVPITDKASPVYIKGAEALRQAAMNRKTVNVPAIVEATGLERQQAVELMDAFEKDGIVSKADPKTRKRKYLLELPKRELRPRVTTKTPVAGAATTSTGSVVSQGRGAPTGTKAPKPTGLGGAGRTATTTTVGKGTVTPALTAAPAPILTLQQRNEYQGAAQQMLRAGAISRADYNSIIENTNLAVTPETNLEGEVIQPDMAAVDAIVERGVQRFQGIQQGTAQRIVEAPVEDEIEAAEKVIKRRAAAAERAAAQKKKKPVTKKEAAPPKVEREARATGERIELSPTVLEEVRAIPEQTEAAVSEAPEQTENTLNEERLANAINGKTITEVLNLVVKSSNSPSYRLVGDQLLRMLDYLVSSGLVKDFRVRAFVNLKGAQGRATLTYQADKNREPSVLNMGIEVEIGKGSADYKTILHEIVHAVMLPLRELGRAARATGQKNSLVDAVNQYEEVGNYIGRQLVWLANNPPKSNQMRALVQDVVLSLNILTRKNGRYTYEIDEIYTWALTDESMQALLRMLPYRREGSVWSRFVNTVSNLLGFKSDMDSALDQILSVTEKMATTADAIKDMRASPGKMIAMGRTPVGRAVAREAKKRTAPAAKVRTPQEMYQESIDELDSLTGDNKGFLTRAREHLKGISFAKLARDLQNYRYVLKQLQDGLEMTGKILRENVGKLGYNNFYDRMMNSTGVTKGVMVSRIVPRFEALEIAARKYSEASKLPYKEVLARLDKTLKALHIGERRRTKFMLFAPLDNTKNDFQITKPDGTKEMVTAAKLREYIWAALHTNIKFQNDAQRQAWYNIVDGYRNQLMQLTDQNNPNNRLDANGLSLADMMEGADKKKPGSRSININDREYNVLGTYYQQEVDTLVNEYNSDPNKAQFDEIIDVVRDIQEETVKLDEEANYWTQGVSNIKQFYGWKNYVPLTGKAEQKVSEEDDTLEFASPRYSTEYRGEVARGYTGRETESQNALLATQAAAVRAAMRVGLKDARQAIHNALSQGILDGKAQQTVKFEDRARGLDEFKYKGNKIFINYNKDGSIDVWELTNPAQANAIRQQFEPEEANKIYTKAIDWVGKWSSRVASMFTRYNLAFGMKNFVRDVFTYSTVFARLGPTAMAKYVANVSTDVARVGLIKAGRISYLYNAGKFDQIEKLAARDARFYRPAWEFLKNGGESVFVQQFTKMSRLQDLVERYNVADAASKRKMLKEMIDTFFDTWASSFELTARVSAYRLRKQEIMADNPSLSDEAAQVSATAWTKGIQNFELVGEKVRRFSKLYYFFRPGATGSVRAMEILRPMFTFDVNKLLAELPDKIKKDPIALRKAEIQLRKDRYNTYIASLAMAGLGYVIYMMMAAMAGDDELERNVVATDKKDLWARSIRIPLAYFGLGEEDEFFQIPWGLGVGSIASMGAQVAALQAGHQTTKDFLSNMMQITSESYLPIQPVKFNPLDPTEGAKSVPQNLAIATLFPLIPSLPRSGLEFLVNVNTLGQQIYRDQSNKYGDAYVDVERIPELYNDVAKVIERMSDGKIDYSPELYHYLVSNFAMGLGNLLADSYSLGLTLMGDKEFDPRRDTVFFSGFFARRPSPDAKKYELVKYEIEDMERELKKLDSLAAADSTNVRNIKFRDKYPGIDGLIDVYRDSKVQIDNLREESNRIRGGQAGDYTTEERKNIVRTLNDDINLYKLQMVQYYEDYKRSIEEE